MELKIGDQFEDFDEFESRFKAFCAQQSVHFVIADSKTVQSANKALSSTAKPYDARFKYRFVNYICKHGPVRKSKSMGLRPCQR